MSIIPLKKRGLFEVRYDTKAKQFQCRMFDQEKYGSWLPCLSSKELVQELKDKGITP